MVKIISIAISLFVVFSTYLFGYHQGKNSEELANARLKISALNATVEELQKRQASDSLSLSAVRLSESAHRDELNRLRNKLRNIERSAKSNADRNSVKCAGLGLEGGELLREAQRAIRFCRDNHK